MLLAVMAFALVALVIAAPAAWAQFDDGECVTTETTTVTGETAEVTICPGSADGGGLPTTGTESAGGDGGGVGAVGGGVVPAGRIDAGAATPVADHSTGSAGLWFAVGALLLAAASAWRRRDADDMA